MASSDTPALSLLPSALAETVPPSQPQTRYALPRAQRCNSDVLGEMFSYLDRVTLANVVRVCRDWQPTASRNLYYAISINAWQPATRILADTLTAHQGLRRLVRHVTLNLILCRTQWVLLPFDWLALLPEHNLLSITLRNDTLYPPEAEISRLLDFPAIRTVPRMCVRTKPSSCDIMVKIMNLPHLEALSISLCDDMEPSRAGLLRPKMRTLAISAYRHGMILKHILRSFASPLRQFACRLHEFNKDDLASLQNGLKRHAPSIKYLSLLGSPFLESAFMDNYILSFPSLETLVCANLAYAPLLVSRLPPTLLSLTLQAPADLPFASNDYATALRQHRHKLPALSELIILDARNVPEQYATLAAMCAEESLSFSVMGQDYSSPFRSKMRSF